MSSAKITVAGKTWSSTASDKQKSENYYKKLAKKQGGSLTPKQISEKQRVRRWFWQLGFKDLVTPKRKGLLTSDEVVPRNEFVEELPSAVGGTQLAGDPDSSLRKETYSPVQQFLETSPLFQLTSPKEERDFTPNPAVPPNLNLIAGLSKGMPFTEGVGTHPDENEGSQLISAKDDTYSIRQKLIDFQKNLVTPSETARARLTKHIEGLGGVPEPRVLTPPNTFVNELIEETSIPQADQFRHPSEEPYEGGVPEILRSETYSPIAEVAKVTNYDPKMILSILAKSPGLLSKLVKTDNEKLTKQVEIKINENNEVSVDKQAGKAIETGAELAHAVGSETKNNRAYQELLASSLLGGGRTDPWDRLWKTLARMPGQGPVSLAEAFTGSYQDVQSAEAAAKKEALARQLKIEDLAARRKQQEITTGIALERLKLAKQTPIPKVTPANINAMITFIQDLGSSADYGDLYSSSLWPEFLGGKPHNKIQMEKILARETLEIMNAERITDSGVALKKAIARRRGGGAAPPAKKKSKAPATGSIQNIQNLTFTK